MAMPTSGPISFSQLQSEWGGSNPISLSEYYLNGAYVKPAGTLTTVTRQPSGGGYIYNQTTDYYLVRYTRASGSGSNNYTRQFTATIRWNNAVVTNGSDGWSYSGKGVASNSPSGARRQVTVEGNETAGRHVVDAYFEIRRSKSTTATVPTANNGIPTSGKISMDQFYGKYDTKSVNN